MSIEEVPNSSGPVARVALPENNPESDEEDATEANEEQADEDFLEDFPSDTEELELLHSRIGSLDNLRLPRFGNHLKKLCLRQNHVSQLDPDTFQALDKLEELDMYDNKLKNVDGALAHLTKLSVLDLSFNLLRSVPTTLHHLTCLDTVYFVQNKIGQIANLNYPSLSTLRSLELGGNRLRKIEGLDALVNLEELWLGKNKISKLENLGHLRKLKILALQSNRITKIEGLENLVNLEQLYFSHNGIKKLEGLENNASTNLTILDVGRNEISALENVSHLSCLEELWMNGNQIPDLLSLEPVLGKISSLETIYLEANPCQANDMSGYRRKIILALPQLKQIDATYVRGV